MQLMSFLEDENNITAYSPPLQRGIKGDFSLIPEANASVTSDYSQRFPTVLGDTLGILLSNGTGSTKNQPVQETGT